VRGPAGGNTDEEKVLAFAAIYRQSKAARHDALPSCPSVTLASDPGYDTPYFPVYVSGRVARVWVPAHVSDQDKDVLVAGHWTFVMVERPHWYVEDPVSPVDNP